MAVVDDLKNTDLFNQVDDEDLVALIDRMERLNYAKGDILFHEGDYGDTMYVITKGRIRIFIKDSAGKEITLTHYGVEEIFGELTPIDERPRSAGAAADEDLEVLVLSRENFLIFLDERPQIGLAMMRSLSQRLRNTTTYLEDFKPQQFERQPAARGEEFRRGAEGVVADILDRVSDEDTQEEVTGGSLMRAFQEKTKSDLMDSIDGVRKQVKGGGIFDRIAGEVAKREDDEHDDVEKAQLPEKIEDLPPPKSNEEIMTRFAEAKEQITQKNYAAARRLIRNIDHPTTQEWLEKIDKLDQDD